MRRLRRWLTTIPPHDPLERRRAPLLFALIGRARERIAGAPRGTAGQAAAQQAEHDDTQLEQYVAELERERGRRQRAEEQLKRSEVWLRAVMEHASEAIWSIDRDYRLQIFNQVFHEEFLHTFGRAPTPGLRLADAISPDMFWKDLYDRALAGEQFNVEQRYQMRGQFHHHVVSFYPIASAGEITGVTAFSHDVTERKLIDQALRESEARLSLLIEQLPALLWITNRDLVITSAVGTALANLQLRPEDLIGASLQHIFHSHGADAPAVLAHQRALAGETAAYEAEWRGRMFQAHAEPFLDAQGRVIGSITIALDISEQMRAGHVREGQRSFFELLATGAPIDTVLKAITHIVEAQIAGGQCSILLLGQPGRGAIQSPAAARTNLLAQIAQQLAPSDLAPGPGVFQATILPDIGAEPRWASLRDTMGAQGLGACWSIPFSDSQGQPLGTFAIFFRAARTPTTADLDALTNAAHLAAIAVERRRIETALREREEQYRLITESTSDLISLVDQAGRIVYVSPSYHSILGYDTASLIGTSTLDFVHPDDLAQAIEQWSQMAGAVAQRSTLRIRHASGAWRWVELLGTSITHQGAPHTVIVGRDVTERRSLEAQLLQAHKMESVGRLAGGVAHDFNNLLTAITGYANLALDSLPGESSARDDIHEIVKSAERAAGLTRQLLTFARRQPIESRLLDLNALIGDVDTLLRRLIGADVELVTHLAPGIGMVRADPGQIEQVLVNLAVNARDAMPAGGTLTITTAQAVLGDRDAQPLVLAAGDYVVLAVGDTGVGMSEDVKQHLFEPFFTTKGPGKGTGLGLPTCYGIVKQHGGHIEVASAPQQGATFTIFLPRAQPQEYAPAQPAAVEHAPLRGAETVLLAEDEPAVRALASRILRAYGYHVLEAADGEAAFGLARAYGEAPINLLLTDIVMPRMNGRLLAEQLLQLFPTMKVLYTSGYTEATNGAFGWQELGVDFIQKPFSPVALARKVRNVLDS